MARDSSPDARAGSTFERLPRTHWTLFRAAEAAAGAGPAAADQVLVGPSGVYVIVHRPGALDVDLAAARAAARRLADLLPVRYRHRLVPVVCMTDDDPVAERRDGVLVTGLSTLEHVARSSPVVLSTSEVRGLTTRLASRLEPVPSGADGPRRRPLPWAALACVAATAAVVCAPLAQDTWQVLRASGFFG